MCRLRIPNGILKAWQFDGVADLAERLGGGYTHVTTRANLQIREIAARDAVELVEGLQDLGLTAERLRRGQHPQRHRRRHGRHRSAGAARHPALRAGVAPPHPQRPLALRPAAQVQRRVRRRRARPDAGGHQRHRLPGRRGDGRRRGGAGRLVPPRARRHHGPQGSRARHRRRGAARRSDAGGRRHRPRLHPRGRPHQPHQGAPEICAGCLGLREIPRCRRGASSARRSRAVDAAAVHAATQRRTGKPISASTSRRSRA